MSSKPHIQGVLEVANLLAKIDVLQMEERELRPKAQRLEEVDKELRVLCARLPELLRSMDLEAQSHYGWEGRMGWFLMQLRRQFLGLCASGDGRDGE